MTNLLVESGQTCVIGGLITNRETEIITKVPWLGDIPVLGLLFKSYSTLEINEELLVFLTPRIVKGVAETTDRLEKTLGLTFEKNQNEYNTITAEPQGE